MLSHGPSGMRFDVGLGTVRMRGLLRQNFLGLCAEVVMQVQMLQELCTLCRVMEGAPDTC